jgi:hypothetical protein
MTVHYVTTCHSTGYFVTLHGINSYITALQQCKCTCKLYYIYLISINTSHVITDALFELSIYAAFNLSWVTNLANFMELSPS